MLSLFPCLNWFLLLFFYPPHGILDDIKFPPSRAPTASGGESLALGEEIGRRIAQHGGAALIIDYGDDHVHSSSLQARNMSCISFGFESLSALCILPS